MGPQIAPYGSWRSPITADLLAVAGLTLGWLEVSGQDVYWVEGRPLESGRYAIVRRTPDSLTEDVIPDGMNARTLAHEYGGGMYFVGGGTVYFSNFADQRLYRQGRGEAPRPITPEPPQAASIRYADGRISPDGRTIICVRERHEPEGVINELVAFPADGSAAPTIIASGCDFYAAPRISPDGSHLAWLCWQNPQMPWDGTELWLADLASDGSTSRPRRVAGGPHESIFQPEWSADGVLHFISDRTNWWNLYRLTGAGIEALCPMEAEFGQPQWVFGLSRYDFLNDGRIACIYSQNGFDHVGLVDPTSKELTPISTEQTALAWLRSAGDHLWLIGGGPHQGAAVFRLNPADGTTEIVQQATGVQVDPAFFSEPRPIEFPTEGGLTAYAIYYPPTNPHYRAPEGELPPLLVNSHGGPTSAVKAQLALSIQFWTSRGIGVVDVNYGGSTGYGREYRERLKGAWGIVDVVDCINAARHLIEQGEVDGKRVAIRGGSAGGYTTLQALTREDFFAAGASYYGVADPAMLARDTHKFEARYLDGLIGPYPEREDLYEERSPLAHADRLRCPVILFQGVEDQVVPISQAEAMVQALEARGIPYAYLAFEGEQHGFRKAGTIIRCAEAELYFYSRVFGFDAADEIDPVPLANL
ncbi:MAG: S9 family peptidase [Anaerolineae bacterium]